MANVSESERARFHNKSGRIVSAARGSPESHTTSAGQPAVKVMGFGKQTKLGSDRESLVSSSVKWGLFSPCLTDSCSED